jgi:ribosomal protein L11 methyltransferase
MATPFPGARSNSRTQTMYLWHKYATARWLRDREAMLQKHTRGGLAVIESPKRTKLHLEVASSSRRALQLLCAHFGGRIERLPRNWRRHFAEAAHVKPLRIGNRLAIQSTRRGDSAKNHTACRLVIPAAGAFGTGAHATTAMCLRLLEEVSRNWPDGWNMLDAGTGSGILALAARFFGAENIIAIDCDPRAIAIAKNNAHLNRTDRVQFEIADAIQYRTRRKFDLIAANLFSELLIDAIPFWKRRLKRTGVLILSGILRDQERRVVRKLRSSNFAIENLRRRGKWIAILASRRQKAG